MNNPQWRKLQQKIKKNEGFLVTDESNLFYLTGFQQEGYWGLLTKDKFFLLFPPLLYLQAKDHFASQLKDTFLILLKNKDLFFLLVRILKKEKLNLLSFEPKQMNFSLGEKLKKESKIKFFLQRNLVTNLREIKDEREIILLRKSCQLAFLGYQYAKKVIHPGMSERELAREIEYYLKKKGAERVAFETIVAGGINSSYPHHLTSNFVFQENDMVLLDLGVTYQGYCSDLTRIIFLGKIPKVIKKVYNTVKKAQEKVLAGIRPGKRVRGVFSFAYQVIEKAGYAKYFLHNLGHGIGIDIHEKPFINSKNREIFKPGMVFTIEPGIYLPQKFGIRIEDVVLVTKKGCEILTNV